MAPGKVWFSSNLEQFWRESGRAGCPEKQHTFSALWTTRAGTPTTESADMERGRRVSLTLGYALFLPMFRPEWHGP
jgi:hypothetical protein